MSISPQRGANIRVRRRRLAALRQQLEIYISALPSDGQYLSSDAVGIQMKRLLAIATDEEMPE